MSLLGCTFINPPSAGQSIFPRIWTMSLIPTCYLGSCFLLSQNDTTIGYHQHSCRSENLAAGSQLTLSDTLIWISFGLHPASLETGQVGLPNPCLIKPQFRVQDNHWQNMHSMTLWSLLERCFKRQASGISAIILLLAKWRWQILTHNFFGFLSSQILVFPHR